VERTLGAPLVEVTLKREVMPLVEVVVAEPAMP
jgi:hypothetical protein